MPDKRISDLTAQTGAGLADGDLFALVDVSDTTAAASGTNKKITRAELLAGLSTRVTFSNAAKTLDAADRYAAQTGTLSASRIVTLQAANAVPAGAQVVVVDESGSVTATNTIEVKPAGSDTIDGIAAATNYPVIRDAYGAFTFRSDGSSKWTVVNRKPTCDVQVFTGSSSWRKPFGCVHVRGILLGGGGGGGGGNRTNAGSNSGGGGGGQAGGITGFQVPISDLGVTETVTVGAGGTAGAGRATTGAGNAGNPGGNTDFGSSSKWVAQGGGGGTGGATGGSGTSSSNGAGTTVGATGGGGSGGTTVAATAGTAGAGSSTGAPFPCFAPGGGGGGGNRSSTTNTGGAAGGASSTGVTTNAAGLTGGTAGSASNGGAGTACTTISSSSIFGGSGGGGGGGDSTARTGGVGGLYGGGGGGGAGANGANSAAGGDGGAGGAFIVSF